MLNNNNKGVKMVNKKNRSVLDIREMFIKLIKQQEVIKEMFLGHLDMWKIHNLIIRLYRGHQPMMNL